jgi:hypothetical protein
MRLESIWKRVSNLLERLYNIAMHLTRRQYVSKITPRDLRAGDGSVGLLVGSSTSRPMARIS